MSNSTITIKPFCLNKNRCVAFSQHKKRHLEWDSEKPSARHPHLPFTWSSACQGSEVKNTPTTDLNTTAYSACLCVYTHKIKRLCLAVTFINRLGQGDSITQRWVVQKKLSERERKKWESSGLRRLRNKREGMVASRAFYGLFIVRWLHLSLFSPSSNLRAKRDAWCERVTSLLILTNQLTKMHKQVFQKVQKQPLYPFGGSEKGLQLKGEGDIFLREWNNVAPSYSVLVS